MAEPGIRSVAMVQHSLILFIAMLAGAYGGGFVGVFVIAVCTPAGAIPLTKREIAAATLFWPWTFYKALTQ